MFMSMVFFAAPFYQSRGLRAPKNLSSNGFSLLMLLLHVSGAVVGGKNLHHQTPTHWIGWQFGVHSSEKTTEIDQKQVDGVGWVRSGRGLGEEGRKRPFSPLFLLIARSFSLAGRDSGFKPISRLGCGSLSRETLCFVPTKAIRGVQWRIWHAINRWHNRNSMNWRFLWCA